MKKVIAILTIAIVLVGAVFAATSTGNAVLKVQTTIEPVEPTFKLATDQVEDELGGDDGATAHVITTNDLLTAEQTVTFDVIQLIASKTVKMYTLTATATDLVLYQYQLPNGTWQNVSGEGGVAHPATDAEKKFTVNATTVNTFANGVLTTAQATYGGSASSKTITYKGTDVAADTKVAYFTCTWDDNATAVPGRYEATITLTIAST